MSDILEVGAKALKGTDVLGCGCCADGGGQRHADGSVCTAPYVTIPDCGGTRRGGGSYTCGSQEFGRDEVGAAAVIAAVRPLIEAEMREQVARELDERGENMDKAANAAGDRGNYEAAIRMGDLADTYREAARIARGGAR